MEWIRNVFSCNSWRYENNFDLKVSFFNTKLITDLKSKKTFSKFKIGDCRHNKNHKQFINESRVDVNTTRG